jgi:hypothetical protein
MSMLICNVVVFLNHIFFATNFFFFVVAALCFNTFSFLNCINILFYSIDNF